MYTQETMKFTNNFIPFLRQIFTWVISKILSDTNVKQVNIYLKLIKVNFRI